MRLPMRFLLLDHLRAAQHRERQQLTAELAKIKDLMPLLMKRRNGSEWTSAERRQLIEQLDALAHLSPYLLILALPGSVLLLPVLAWWLDRRRYQRSARGAPANAVPPAPTMGAAHDRPPPAAGLIQVPDKRT